MSDKKMFSVRLETSTIDDLQALADKQGVPTGKLARTVLKSYVFGELIAADKLFIESYVKPLDVELSPEIFVTCKEAEFCVNTGVDSMTFPQAKVDEFIKLADENELGIENLLYVKHLMYVWSEVFE